jgi:wyosine [tRNA(Phe)-imidazoG37] synthetase (radical SAM superfamily)
MNVIFGPVASRRFGKSLGIDLSPRGKQCNFDCIYCELEPAPPWRATGRCFPWRAFWRSCAAP